MTSVAMPAVHGTNAQTIRPSILKLDGDLDLFTRSTVRERLATLAASDDAIIDLTDARIADATFLGELTRLTRGPAASNRAIVLVAPNPMMRKVLRLVQFDKIFPIVVTLAQAQALIEWKHA